MLFLPSSAAFPELRPAPFSRPRPPRRRPIASTTPPLWLWLAAFVLPLSLYQPVRSRKTEWQLLIGGRGTANQKGAPHVRTRSFKRWSRGARGGGWGGGRCHCAGTRSEAPAARVPDPAAIGPPSASLAPSQSPAKTSWGGCFRSLAFRPPDQTPPGPGSLAAAGDWRQRSYRRDEARESLSAGPAPGADAAAGRGEGRGGGRR